MASHVVVRDSTARRATVKTQPGTHLSDVLVEACKKLKLNPELYGLKYGNAISPIGTSTDELHRHNQKPIDLSRTFRLSGLPAGALLELIQASKTATVINVALQLPASENNRRLTDKLPSTTSIWQLLRHFESKNSLNFTQRATPQGLVGQSGAGRLCYEMPVVDALGRQVDSFVGLQKTLSQLGITSGSALLRLNFKNSGQPLEEAMQDISQYFKEAEPAGSESAPEASTSQQPVPKGGGDLDSMPQAQEDRLQDPMEEDRPEPSAPQSEPNPAPIAPEGEPISNDGDPSLPTGGRKVQIFHAPTSATLAAADFPDNESDYAPGLEHAVLHQARLKKESRNRKLLSDGEIATQEKERQAVLSTIESVKARIRLPDQDAIMIDFTKDDTGADVYKEVRSGMEHPDSVFSLKYYNDKAQHVALEDGPKKLISQLGWRGSMQINMLWNDSVPADIRSQPSLSAQWRNLRQHAAPIQAPARQPEEDSSGPSSQGKAQSGGKKISVEDKMKKFLGMGKKR